jgi:hypothetical protein
MPQSKDRNGPCHQDNQKQAGVHDSGPGRDKGPLEALE